MAELDNQYAKTWLLSGTCNGRQHFSYWIKHLLTLIYFNHVAIIHNPKLLNSEARKNQLLLQCQKLLFEWYGQRCWFLRVQMISSEGDICKWEMQQQGCLQQSQGFVRCMWLVVPDFPEWHQANKHNAILRIKIHEKISILHFIWIHAKKGNKYGVGTSNTHL